MALGRSQDNPGFQGVVYVVEERANPSTDYFVFPALSAAGHRLVRCGFNDLPGIADLAGAVVVFVRYVSPQWAKLVERERSRLRALALFMDDDVLDTGASAGMPLRYRFKLARLAAWRRRWLRRMGAELWVSTPHLERKYADWNPRLILPTPPSGSSDVCRVFYHGSASHGAEIRWIRPVLDEVLRRDRRITFEIIGGQDVNRLYRGMPRVTVVHAMRWNAYQAFLASPGRHIGLAPLLDLPFNEARSYTKFFDITRCGAVGIYARNSYLAEVVDHEVDGLLAPSEQTAWVEAILRLAQNEPLRRSMALKADKKLKALSDRAARNNSNVLTWNRSAIEHTGGIYDREK